MSDPTNDGFIDEVTDALRRDQLFAFFRRWGWLALLCVLLIVGGAAYLEWRKASLAATAQSAGGALLDALDAADPGARLTGLDAVPLTGEPAMLREFLAANVEAEAGDIEAAAARLDAIAATPGLPEPYCDLAVLKAAMLRAGTADEAALRAALEPVSLPGRPFRLLALEQIALSELRAGETDAATERLTYIREDAELTAGLRQRVEAVLLSLGVELAPLPEAPMPVEGGQ